MHHLHPIYNISTSLPSIQPLFFVGLVVFICVSAYLSKKRGEDRLAFRKISKSGALILAICSSAIFLVIFGTTISQYFANRHIYENTQIQFIEGYVANYHPMPFGGHDTERFDVKGVHFEYADDDMSTGGYNNAASRGGAIKPNLYVRIGYFNKGTGNIILSLETE